MFVSFKLSEKNYKNNVSNKNNNDTNINNLSNKLVHTLKSSYKDKHGINLIK